jgi:diacylglycerol kinase
MSDKKNNELGDGSHFDQRDRNSRKDAETPREKTLRLCVFARAFGSNEDHPHELYNRAKSFRYAFEGWWYVLRTQHNAWIHALISVAVLGMGLWLGVPRSEWAILILAMMAVWMAEFMNTALEAVVDLAAPEYHPLAKVAKDVAAAAVLVGALGAVLVGLLILGPPLWQKITFLVEG